MVFGRQVTPNKSYNEENNHKMILNQCRIFFCLFAPWINTNKEWCGIHRIFKFKWTKVKPKTPSCPGYTCLLDLLGSPPQARRHLDRNHQSPQLTPFNVQQRGFYFWMSRLPTRPRNSEENSWSCLFIFTILILSVTEHSQLHI